MDAIILAGGGGTRLWPVSNKNKPKQFLKIFGDRSLLQNTVKRVLKLAPENILILTNKKQEELVIEDLKEINCVEKVSIVCEPYMKNTAPAITLGIKYLKDVVNSKEKVVFVTPSDSYIEPEDDFVKLIKNSENFCLGDYLLTFGALITRVETGYGYIEKGEKIEKDFYRVKKFIEKPDYERALEFKNSGKHLWNSGMFMFNVETFLNELEIHYSPLFKLYKREFEDFYENFNRAEGISIDYALMEKSDKVAVLPISIVWNDVGSWDSIFEIEAGDENGNIKKGEKIFFFSSNNSYVWNGINSKKIVLIDVNDLVIIDTKEALLIFKRGSGQKIRDVVKFFREKGGS